MPRHTEPAASVVRDSFSSAAASGELVEVRAANLGPLDHSALRHLALLPQPCRNALWTTGQSKPTTRLEGLMHPRVIDDVELSLLLSLYHLRYLHQQQIHQLWYSDRTSEACRVRLSRLATSYILSRQKCVTDGQSVYSLGREGFRKLRELRAAAYQPTPLLTQLYLPHHLDTNQVFACLAHKRPVAWENLPFTWSGTLQSALYFEESRRDSFGVLRKRRALLRPDAIITTSDRRVFLELDRSTECIREADERRSIRRKLAAYATFIFKGAVAEDLTWHDKKFSDGKRPRVIFVLTRRDQRFRDPDQAHRRCKSVLQAAGEVDARLDAHCVYLDDSMAIRSLCGVTGGSDMPSPPSSALEKPPQRALESEDVAALHRFYRLAAEALRRHAAQNPIDPGLRAAAREAKAVLQRLSN